MADFIIAVHYTFKKEGDRELAVKEMTESGVLAAIRNENGCLTYDYYYSADNPKALALYEEWESAQQEKYDYVVINDKLEECVQEVMQIIHKYTQD